MKIREIIPKILLLPLLVAGIFFVIPSQEATVTAPQVGQETAKISGESFDISRVSYRGDAYTMDEAKNAREVDFKSDGMQFSIVSRAARKVFTYEMAEPWDVKTARLAPEKTYDFSREIGTRYRKSVAHGFYIKKDDGKKMWIWNRREAWEYTLAEAWNPATATQTGFKDFSKWAKRAHDIDFSPDGKFFYFDDRMQGVIAQFFLRTPWNIETASFIQTRIIRRQKAMRGIEFRPDGLALFICDPAVTGVYQYRLSKPWDISTLSFEKKTSVYSSGKNPRNITWHPDGKSFYIVQTSTKQICRFWVNEKK